jgi:hypothetical protein
MPLMPRGHDPKQHEAWHGMAQVKFHLTGDQQPSHTVQMQSTPHDARCAASLPVPGIGVVGPGLVAWRWRLWLAGRRSAGLVSALATSALARRRGRDADAAHLCRGTGHAHTDQQQQQQQQGSEREPFARAGRPDTGAQSSSSAARTGTGSSIARRRGLFAWPRVGRGEERSATTRGGLHSTGTDRPLPSFPRAPLSSEASSLPCWAWLPAGPLFLLFCPHRQQIMLVRPVVSRVHAWTDGRRRVDVDSIHRSWSLALDNDRPGGPCG